MALISIVRILKKRNVYTFNDIKKSNFTLIRHDIDLDLHFAEKIAKIEFKEKIKSTYFIQLTCETYNIFTLNNRILLKKLIKMGHEIGLHFDTSITKDINKEFKFQIDTLSEIIDTKVRSVSLHNPSINKKIKIFKGYNNAYEKKFYQNSIYISDSCMLFNKNNIINYIKSIPYEKSIQILIHPLHFGKKQRLYKEILLDNIFRYSKTINKNFSVNKTYKKDKIKEVKFKL